MRRKEVLKRFIDYFLGNKSPLKIYRNRPEIGSYYANPNFGMLLKTVENMVEFYFSNQIKLDREESIMLTNFNFMQKIIDDGHESIAAKIVRMVCPRNLHASEKFAIVLLKGIGKTTFESIPPYLDVIHEFILIEDEFQMMRVKWVIGKQRLVVSQISKTLSAMNSYSLEERLYDFNSAIILQNSSSLLEPLYAQNKKT